MVAWLAAALAASPLVRVEKDPAVTLIHDVVVFQADGTLSAPQDVWLAEGRIEAIGVPGAFADRQAHRTIDGHGQTLLPGLVDTHVHIGAAFAVPGRIVVPNARDNLGAFLYAGVTTVLSTGDMEKALAKARARIAAKTWAGPKLYASGRPFTAPGGHPKSAVLAMFPGPLVKAVVKNLDIEVTGPDDVRAAFAANPGFEFNKVMIDAIPVGVPIIDDRALEAVAAETHAHQRRLLAHVGHVEDLDRGLHAGVDAFAHTPYLDPLPDALINEIAERKVAMMGTLAVWDGIAALSQGTAPGGESPLVREILPAGAERRLALVVAGKVPYEGSLAPWAADVAIHRADVVGNMRRLHEAGVTVLVGSDSPNLGTIAGAGTHREIDLLREAGFTPAETLVAATWGNSRFLDPNASFGAVQAGMEADLLLVQGDPLADPAALGRIAGVWTDGRWVARSSR